MPVIATLRLRLCLLLFALATLVSLGAPPARAQVVVSLGCTIGISTVAFGGIDVLPGASASTNATLSVICTGLTVGASTMYVCVVLPPRAMTGSSGALAYDIYGPSPSVGSWSNTTPIAVPTAALALGQTYSLNVVAGVLGSQQAVPPGTYTQTLAATATYGYAANCSGSASTSFSFQANATVLKSCNVSAGNLDFGGVGDLDTAVDGQSVLSLQCTRGTGYTVGLNGGLSNASDPTARKMTLGGQSIIYGLYQNSGRTVPWGTLAAATLGGTGTAATQTIPVYGRVPVQATPGIGTYSDTIVVSVTY